MNADPPSSSNPSLADAVEHVAASVVGVVTHRHAAAGVLWQPGVVVTSASAFGRAAPPQLVLPDGETVDGRWRGGDAATDLAAVAFDGSSWPAVARDATPATRSGDVVFAVGREPSGLVHASFGRIGAAGGPWRSWRGGLIDALIRLDGGLYPGLAGAPVADAAGRVLGIASAAFSRWHGVVLPAATIDRVLPALLAHGRVPRGHLGVALQPVRAQLEGQGVDGLLVSSVAEAGPAARAGMLVGDVIVSAGGSPTPRLDALRDRVAAVALGSPLTLTVARAGQRVQLSVEVGEQPARGCH